jgi:exopolyphosphatase/guanosine-5'-triphosphate,3'-diphosphate pyrophosphatase
VRIGEGLAATGELGEAGMAARAGDDGGLRPLLLGQRHRSRRRRSRWRQSAIRDASNSAQFLERAQAASGLRVRVLSGEEEARYGYLAAVNSTTLSDGVMLDIGGGSMQLVHVVGRHRASSTPGAWARCA